VKPYVAALAAVQDRLGAINDAITAQALLDQLDRDHPPADAAGRAGARALIAGWASARIAENLAALPELWAEFAALKPFWR
jgi:triphosphatase